MTATNAGRAGPTTATILTGHSDSSAYLDARLAEAHRLVFRDGADAGDLYRRWFHADTGVLQAWPGPAAYRTATLQAGKFENGWRVMGPAPGRAGAVFVMRGGRERAVAPPEMTPADPRQLAPGPGALVKVHPLLGAESGGFWHVWSVGWQREAPERYRRVYLPIAPSGAVEVVALLTAVAPTRSTWAMKVLCGVHDGGRRDGALLYVPAETSLNAGWVAAAVNGVRSWCVGELPPFVAPLGPQPGPGWAPDPGDGRSFGERVCEALADVAGNTTDPVDYADAARRAIAALPGMRTLLDDSADRPTGARADRRRNP